MRTNLIILSAVALLAACGDDNTSTAPVSKAPPGSASTTLAYPPGPSAPSQSPTAGAGGKVTPFTTIARYESSFQVYGGQGNGNGQPWAGTLFANCPAGSFMTGGGYDVGGLNPTDLKVLNSRPGGYTFWQVSVQNTGGPSSMATLKAHVVCIS